MSLTAWTGYCVVVIVVVVVVDRWKL